MKLSKILKIKDLLLIKDPEISDITTDSRNVKKGSLFIAIKGFKTDGHEYIPHALKNGASAVLTEKKNFYENEYPDTVFVKLKNIKKILSSAASNFYRHPEKRIFLSGITGTNGKTTNTYLLSNIINKSGKKTGIIGTINTKIDKKILPSSNTTPSIIDLYGYLYQMEKAGVKNVIMEVSSHGIDQGRIDGLNFKIAVFTNLTQDHLDYNKNIENYFKTKLGLFTRLKKGSVAVINTDDPYGVRITKRIKVPYCTYGIKKNADFFAKDIKLGTKNSSFTVVVKEKKEFKIKFRLLGLFNVYNALSAFASAYLMGIKPDIIVKALNYSKPVAGRFQTVNAGQEFVVVIDYAHTPDGLENVLSSAKQVAKGRLLTVFGCGGDRDMTKRPIMGEIAGKYCDFCILTSDNPRTEDPEEIINQVESGTKKTNAEYVKITDRKKAIYEIIKMAEKDDLIVIAGKGHETYQIFKDRTIHFDDAEVASEAIRSRIKIKSTAKSKQRTADFMLTNKVVK